MGLFDKLKKKSENIAQGVWNQVNPLDGGKTYSNPNPKPNVPQEVQQKVQTAKYGVLANNPQAQNQFLKGIQPTKVNLFANTMTSAANAPLQVGKTIGKPFWESADAGISSVKALNAKFTGNQKAYNNAATNVTNSLDQSLVGGAKRFGQSVATAVGTPLMNRMLDNQKKYSDQILGKALTTNPFTGAQDARGNIIKQGGNYYYSGGQSATEDNSLENSYRIRQEALNKSGVNMNDSKGTLVRKIGAQGAGAGLDLAFSGLLGKSLVNAPARQMLKNSVEGGVYGLTGGLSQAAQMDAPTKADYLKSGGLGLATGVTAPVGMGLLGKAGGKVKNSVSEARATSPMVAIQHEQGILQDMQASFERAKGPAKEELRKQVLAQQQKIQDMQYRMKRGGFVRIPGKPTELMVTHNLSADNLAKAKELGGIPQASVGIVDPKKYAIDGYGDITLIGNNNLVDPKAPRTKTFASDVYSPRQPRSYYSGDRKVYDTLRNKFRENSNQLGEKYLGFDSATRLDEAIANERSVMLEFLRNKGKKIDNPASFDRYEYKRAIRDAGWEDEFLNYTKQIAEEAGAKKVLWGGTTPSGNPKELPENMDNILKIMRKDKIRAGEQGFGAHGLGNIRARVTPEFKSIKEIVDNKSRLTNKETMDATKELLDRKIAKIQEKLDKYANSKDSNSFMEYDAQQNAIGDYLMGGSENIQWFNHKFKNVPESIMKELDAFKKELQDAPTEYFESVSDRAVKLNEFEKALIPEGLSKDQRETIVAQLNAEGIQPIFYRDGERQAVLTRLMEEDNAKRNVANPITSRQAGFIRNPLVNEDGTPRIGKGAPIEKTPNKPITVYRGDYTREQALNNATSTSLDPNVAKSFSDNGKIRKFTVDPNAKVIDITTLRKQILGVDKFPDPNTLTKEQFDSITGDGLINYAKANGYDVIDHSKAGIKSSGIRPGKLLDEQEYQIVNDRVLKEISDSGAPIEKTPQTQTAPTLPKTREVPQIAELQMSPAMKSPDGTMTNTGGDMATPNNGELAPIPPKGKETKFASKTVPGSEFVSDKIKGSIKAPEYSVQTEKQGYASALSRLKKEGDTEFENKVFDNLSKKNGTISRQDAIDAQTLAAVLDGGDDASIRKATQIYERLSEHYTAAGQLTQAAAVMARRSPEGLRSFATTSLKKSGVKITPDLEKKLTTLVQAVRQASPESKPRAQWEVMNFVAKNTPTSTGDKVINTWRAGLLTAPTTTGGNLLGNSGEMAVRKAFVNPVATAADTIMGAFTGKRTMSLAKAGSGTKGFTEGGKMLPDYLKTGYDPRNNNAKFDAPSRINTGNKALDTYINGTYRLMGVADMPFSISAEKEALSSIAKAEAINKGLKGKARTDFVNEFMANPPETALARAQKEADYATFKNPTTLGKAATGLKRPLGAVGDFVVPFTQVPAAIATRIVERTPIGTANEMIKQIKNVKEGGTFDQRAMAQAIGNGAFGPAIMGVGYALANQDLLTYGYPTDQKERKLWDSEGKQPYSVRVGDRWYSLNYLQPFGTLLAIGGQANKARKEGKDVQAIIGQGIATGGQSIMNQSFLKGIGGALDAISDPERSVKKYVEQTTSSIVPNFIRSGARASDPIQRSPEGLVEGVKSGIPGLRESTTPKLDMFGQPLPAKDTFANQYFNPLKPSKARGDKTTEELRRLFNNDSAVVPTEANATVFGKDKKLTSQQLTELNSTTGGAMKTAYDSTVSDPRYQALSDEDKVKTLKKVNDVVYGAEKVAWAVKNGLVEPDPSNLTKDQIAYLQGQGVDFYPKSVVKAPTTKKVATKTSAKKSTKKGSSKKVALKLPSVYKPKTVSTFVKAPAVKKAVFKGKKSFKKVAKKPKK